MCRNKVLALIAGLCLVFPVAIAEAGKPNGNSGNGEGSTNSNYLNGKPFSALAEAISINAGAIVQIVQIRSDIMAIQSELSEIAKTFSELEQGVSANEDGISALESQANELATPLAESMYTLADLQSALAGLQDDVAANHVEIEALEATIVEVKSEIEVNSAEMGKLLNELRQELDVQKAGLDDFKKEFAEYRVVNNETITHLQNEMSDAISEIAATDTVKGETLATILFLQDAINNINSDLIALNSSYITLCDRFNEHTHIYYDSWQLFYGAFRVTGKPSNPLSSQ